jgi:hypothetical protein
MEPQAPAVFSQENRSICARDLGNFGGIGMQVFAICQHAYTEGKQGHAPDIHELGNL